MTKESYPGERVKALVEKMLESGLVQKVLAFGAGLDDNDLVPLFIEDKDEVEKLTFASYYPSSLSRLLKDYGDKNGTVGMVVRACDARGLVELAKRNQVKRDTVYLIGIECSGVADPNAVKSNGSDLHIYPQEMVSGSEKKPVDLDLIRANCRRCDYPMPTMADISCRITPEGTTFTVYTSKGEEIAKAAGIEAQKAEAPSPNPLAERAQEWQNRDFSALRDTPARDRLEYWMEQFDKCIKCYGCRNVCPVCYCKECYLGPNRILVKRGTYPPERMFHLTRLAHIADSCVNCGMCEAVCPMEIPLTKLYHMVNKELSSIFNYESGISLDAPPPLGCFSDQEATMGGADLE